MQPSDLKITTSKTGLALPFVIDGEIQQKNLGYAGLDEKWLMEKVKGLKVDVKDLIYLEMDSQGAIHAQTHNQVVTTQDVFQQLT